jgi:6-phosphogluconolactonase
MEQRDGRSGYGSAGGVSRRSLLKGVAAIGAVTTLGAARPAPAAKPGGRVLAYVGTYTPNGQGIYLFEVDGSTGALTQLKVFPSMVNPSWIAFDPTNRFLYSANEISNFNGTTTGSVSAYAVNAGNGDLTLLNTVTSGGAGPAHLSVDPLGKFVFVANYGGGNVAVLPVQGNGSLGNPTHVVNDTSACTPACPVGPTHAVNAPPGSFAISGHDAPHAHMIQTDPAGNFVIANDLGLDLTIVWQLNRPAGQLINHQTVPSSAGAGPRHFAFHPNGVWFYSLNEEASTIAFMTYDAASGVLTPVEEISTLPDEFVGTNFTSEVLVSQDGKIVYAANRLHDTIASFSIDHNGALTLVGEEWTRGDYPRSFNIDPNGQFMYVCNHRGDSVTTYRVHAGSGKLTFTDQYTAVGSPAVITFLTLP